MIQGSENVKFDRGMLSFPYREVTWVIWCIM